MATLGGGGSLSRGGIVVGIGLGGLFDSFMFHMILQWHHMLSNVIPADSMENIHRLMVFDGFFDVFNFAVLLIGAILLWRAGYYRVAMPSFGPFLGQMLFGAGLFNLIEGVIDHHLLAIHYVRQVPEYAYYNWGFLAAGALLPLVLGWMMMNRSGRRSLRG
jgi:uncharacterized membrane protein